MATVLQNASCPHCTGPISCSVEHGTPFPCPNCGNTVMLPEGQQTLIKINMTLRTEGQSGGVNFGPGSNVKLGKGSRVVGQNLVEHHVHYHDGVPPASIPTPAYEVPPFEPPPPGTVDLSCPVCHRVTDEYAKAGKRYTCFNCDGVWFITADGLTIMPYDEAVAKGLVIKKGVKKATAESGSGDGVNIEGGDYSTPDDLVGSHNIKN